MKTRAFWGGGVGGFWDTGVFFGGGTGVFFGGGVFVLATKAKNEIHHEIHQRDVFLYSNVDVFAWNEKKTVDTSKREGIGREIRG
jgi:hypothetical protein